MRREPGKIDRWKTRDLDFFWASAWSEWRQGFAARGDRPLPSSAAPVGVQYQFIALCLIRCPSPCLTHWPCLCAGGVEVADASRRSISDALLQQLCDAAVVCGDTTAASPSVSHYLSAAYPLSLATSVFHHDKGTQDLMLILRFSFIMTKELKISC